MGRRKPPHLRSEPLANRVRTIVVRRGAGLFLVALVTAGAVALFGSGGEPAPMSAPRPAAAEDVGALVEQLSAASSRDVVRRLERRVQVDPAARTLALLGLGYQQLFRETADPSWLTRALAALGRSVRSGTRDPLAVTGLAQLANTQHRFRAAEQLAREAVAADPEGAAPLAALGDALFNLGRYPAAFRAYDRLAELGPSVGAYARVAVARRLLGRHAAAIDAMELALEAGSVIPEQQAWAHVQRGGMLLAADRVDDAATAYRAALALAPGYVLARTGLARVEAARGRYLAAARRLEGVVAALPSPEHAILLGDAWTRAGRPARAARAFATVDAMERLLAANGVRTELQTAVFDLDRGHRKDDALRRARAAYAAAPGVAAADAVAWGLARTGRCRDALSWSRRALALGTRDGLALFHRGRIERCLGHERDARRYMQAALVADAHFSLRWAPAARRAVA